MGPVGVQEMIVIFLVALVLFGPKKLPELGKTIGKALTEFRRAQSELKSTFETHMRELEKESESIKEVTRSFTNDVYPTEVKSNYEQYDSPYYDNGAYGSEPYSSTEASSSTVGASAIQGAESTGSHEIAGPVSAETASNGTVPRLPAAAHSDVHEAPVGSHPTPESPVKS